MFFGGDPFEHFGHGGGGGRSHRASRGGGGAAADTTKLYETLGVSLESSLNAVIFQSSIS
jgi:hypothetical protein